MLYLYYQKKERSTKMTSCEERMINDIISKYGFEAEETIRFTKLCEDSRISIDVILIECFQLMWGLEAF